MQQMQQTQQMQQMQNASGGIEVPEELSQ